MKILIVTASMGSGHEKAAKAVEQGIIDLLPDSEVVMVDYMSKEVSAMNAAMKAIYLYILHFVPYLYECLYNFTAGSKGNSFLQRVMAHCMLNTMKSLLRRYNPDVIICTHAFPADAISELSEKWRSKFLSALLITDYTVHPMCVCPNIDLFFVAHSAMKVSLYAQGIKQGTVFDTGIPIDKCFYKSVNRSNIRHKYGFNDDEKVILLMGGGLGLGGMDEVLRQLDLVPLNLQVIVVTGRNQELFIKVKEKAKQSRHNIMVLGYTDNVRELMEAADVLITKPGGMTLSEAMAVHLPMLLNQPIPGPETDNARYMSEHGIARWLRTDEPLSNAVVEMLESPDVLLKMRQAAGRHCRENAVKQIVANISDFLLKK